MEVQPELRLDAEIEPEAYRRIRRNVTLATEDAGDTHPAHADVFGEAIWGNAHRFQEIQPEYLAGMNVRESFYGESLSGVLGPERTIKRCALSRTTS